MKLLDEIKVAIVEDEAISSDELKYIISKDGRFKVVGQAYDGISALTLIESEEPDIVFIDIKMPIMSGTALLEQIRKDGYKFNIVIMTAFATIKNAVTTTKLGAKAYLQK